MVLDFEETWSVSALAIALVVGVLADLAWLRAFGGPAVSLSPALVWLSASAALLFGWAGWRRGPVGVPVARRDVIEQLPEAVILTDASGCVLDLNPAAEALLGVSLAAVRGLVLSEVPVEGSVGRLAVHGAPFARAVARVLAGGEPFTARAENDEGDIFEVQVAAVRSDRGEASGLYVILREITQQTRFDALMRQSQRLETVAGLAAGIAHEVNNPLAYVRSNLSHVHRSLEVFPRFTAAQVCDVRGVAGSPRSPSPLEKAERDELLLAIEEGIEGVDRIGRIIDRVRRFSRIGTEELALADANDIVRAAVRVAQLGRFGSVRLELSLAEDLPAIEASAEALTQAVTNLVVNGAQAVAERGGAVKVATRAVVDQVEIRVEDDGPGIPAAVRERIFDPFFTTKKPGEGTGLGLAVSFGIAREHGGVLLYEPERAAGSAFLVRLPVAPEAL